MSQILLVERRQFSISNPIILLPYSLSSIAKSHFRMVEIEYPQAREDTLAEVFYDGTVVLAYLQALEIRCHGFDLSQFPFDQQTCSTRYGSWARSNEQILLTTGKVIEQEKQFRNHSEWDIISFIPRTEDGICLLKNSELINSTVMSYQSKLRYSRVKLAVGEHHSPLNSNSVTQLSPSLLSHFLTYKLTGISFIPEILKYRLWPYFWVLYSCVITNF